MNAFIEGYDVRYIWESLKQHSALKCQYPNFCHVFKEYAQAKGVMRNSERRSAAKPKAVPPRFSPPQATGPVRPPIVVPIKRVESAVGKDGKPIPPRRDFSEFGKPSLDAQLRPDENK